MTEPPGNARVYCDETHSHEGITGVEVRQKAFHAFNVRGNIWNARGKSGMEEETLTTVSNC